MFKARYTKEHKIRQERNHTNSSIFGSNACYTKDIDNIINSVSPSSILDYGCGKGLAGKDLAKRINIDVRLYDPFVVEYNCEPDSADLVICWNVLNNVETDFISAVVDHLYDITNKDLIVKLPLLKHSTRYYLNYFKKFSVRSVNKNICDIVTFEQGIESKRTVTVLTVWFTKP